MGTKGRTPVGTVRKELAEKYKQEADELGVSRSEYIRKCIEVGRLTFRTSGKIDINRLRELTEEESASTDSDLETSGADLGEAILRNLPTDENRALSPEEIREAVFGTNSEQQEEIVNGLKKLRKAGMIEALVGDKYIKTEDYNE
jgi:hypothetical protein